jgi:hypothetical protein
MRTLRARKSPGAGYTLIEVIVSALVLMVLLSAFYAFYRSQVFGLLRQHVEVNTKEGAEIGLDFMLREIRMAGARPLPEPYQTPTFCAARPAINPTPTGGCPAFNKAAGFPWITVAGRDLITFQYDYRGDTIASPPVPDGCPDDANEVVSYSYDGANQRILRAIDGGTTVTVIENVPANSFLLRYFTRTGTELTPGASPASLTVTQIAQIAEITVELQTRNPRPHPNVPAGIGANETTTIYMRNPPC